MYTINSRMSSLPVKRSTLNLVNVWGLAVEQLMMWSSACFWNVNSSWHHSCVECFQAFPILPIFCFNVLIIFWVRHTYIDLSKTHTYNSCFLNWNIVFATRLTMKYEMVFLHVCTILNANTENHQEFSCIYFWEWRVWIHTHLISELCGECIHRLWYNLIQTKCL